MGMFGLPIAPGFAWPMVDPGGFPLTGELPKVPAEGVLPAVPAEGVLPAVPAEDVLPAVPAEDAAPAPAACAIANELESASAPANAIVANFMGHFPWLVVPGQPVSCDQRSLTSP